MNASSDTEARKSIYEKNDIFLNSRINFYNKAILKISSIIACTYTYINDLQLLMLSPSANAGFSRERMPSSTQD